jgi:hypothetical protein
MRGLCEELNIHYRNLPIANSQEGAGEPLGIARFFQFTTTRGKYEIIPKPQHLQLWHDNLNK